MSDFASRLKLLRKEKGIRQVDLATEIGVAQTTIANYEQHSRFPDEDTLRNIADFFDVTLDFLLGRSDSPYRESRIIGLPAGEDSNGGKLKEEASDYLSLLLDGRKDDAGKGILKAVGDGMPVRAVYRDIFEPALKEIGRLWETGEIDIAKEHYFSEETEALMSRLRPFLSVGKRERGTVVCLSVTSELHHIGIRMISDILEEEGWLSFYLGVNVPTSALIRAIEEQNADVLAVSATMPFNTDVVSNTISRIRSSFSKRELKIVAGGRAFNMEDALWKRLGADGFAADLNGAVKLFGAL